MHTTMRSQDAWLGLPYDIFATTILMELMAGWLDADLGHYLHNVDSLHLYANRQSAAAHLTRTDAKSAVMEPLGVP